MKYILLALMSVFLLAGCNPPKDKEAIQNMKANTEAIVKPLEGKKITKVRISEYSIDIVAEDGTLVTIFSYRPKQDGTLEDGGRIGAR